MRASENPDDEGGKTEGKDEKEATMEKLVKRFPVVVITGASAGVGRAVARRFAEDGASIGLIARDPDRLEAVRAEVKARGGRALCFPVDVTDAEAVEAAAAAIEEVYGPIDIWINNVMVTVVSEVVDMTPEEYRRVTDVCYHGFVHGTLSALRRMWPRDRGKIVQVGSALAYRAIPLQSAYCAAKHAIEGFTESLRSEILHHRKNISITMVQLPAVNTPQFDWCKTRMPREPQPVPPIYQPEAAAQVIHRAAHGDRREIVVGFRTLILLWGNKFFPGFGDWYLAKTGYRDQQTGRPVDPDRKDNLWEPVPGPFSARGRFSDRSGDKAMWF